MHTRGYLYIYIQRTQRSLRLARVSLVLMSSTQRRADLSRSRSGCSTTHDETLTNIQCILKYVA